LTSILIANFILAFVEEIAGLTHLFDAKIILLFSLSIICLSGYWVNKKQLFENENVIGNNISKTSILLVLGAAFFIFCYQKNMFPPFTPDTVGAYLPWARTIVEQGSMSAFDAGYSGNVVAYPPFLYATIAFLFSFFDTYSASIPAAIPILYSCFFVFLITNWGEEYTGHDIPYFIALSLLTSSFFVYNSTPVLQEAPLLFFATASFYFLFKYLKNKEVLFLVLLCISSSLMSLTKYSGLVISLMLFCIAIIGTKDKKGIYQILVLFPLIHIPNILWAVRNFYFFNNPIYPTFSSTFQKIPLSYTFHFMFLLFLISFPAFVFTLIYILRNMRKIEVRYLIACFSVFIIFLYVTEWRLLPRYLIPFFGVFALYAGIEISRWYSAIPMPIKFTKLKLKIKRNTIIKFIVIIIFVMPLVIIPSGISHEVIEGDYKSIVNEAYISCLHNPMEPHFQSKWNVLNYLQSSEKEKNLIIFGESNWVLTVKWYENYTLLDLNYNINGEPFDFNQNSAYIYNNLKKIGVDYVYAAHHGGALEQILFNKINEDTEHFELVYNQDGQRLWKITGK
jgi:hypothetical protein